MNRCVRNTRNARRGGTSIAMLIIVATIGLLLIGMVHTSTRDQLLTVRRLETVRSFYAAEAGVNMAVHELVLASDEDGDGGIGTISNDGNPANDPAIGDGNVMVDASVSGGQTISSSHGRSGESRRTIELITE